MSTEMVQPTQGDAAMAYRIVSDFRVGGWPAKEGEVARLIAQVRVDGMAAGREAAVEAVNNEIQRLDGAHPDRKGWTVISARIDQCQKVKAAILRKKEEDHGIRA